MIRRDFLRSLAAGCLAGAAAYLPLPRRAARHAPPAPRPTKIEFGPYPYHSYAVTMAAPFPFALKHITFCDYCGSTQPDGSERCQNCGASETRVVPEIVPKP